MLSFRFWIIFGNSSSSKDLFIYDEKPYKADTVCLNANKVELIYVVDLFLMFSFCKRPASLIVFENYDTPCRPGVLQHLDEVPT